MISVYFDILNNFEKAYIPENLSTFLMSIYLKCLQLQVYKIFSQLNGFRYQERKYVVKKMVGDYIFAVKIRLDSFDTISRRTCNNDYEKWRNMKCLDLLSEL